MDRLSELIPVFLSYLLCFGIPLFVMIRLLRGKHSMWAQFGWKSVQLGHTSFRSFDAFLETFGTEVGLGGDRSASADRTSIAGTKFGGEVLGRQAQIVFQESKITGAVSARLTVPCDPVLRFIVKDPRTTRTGFGLLERILVGPPKDAVKSGDLELDEDVLILAPEHEKTEKAFQHRELRELVSAAFHAAPSLDTSVVAGRGELSVTIPTAEVKHESYRKLLELLAKAARSVDRVSLAVHVLGGERRAFQSHAGSPRCAYCHEDVIGNEPDLIACSSCATVLHESCWSDNGRCTVLGCAGKTPERAPTR